jgi:hypothetical protein
VSRSLGAGEHVGGDIGRDLDAELGTEHVGVD